MAGIWFEVFGYESIRMQDAYTGVSRGQCLRKLNPPLPLSRKMERYFLESPPALGYVEALRFAQIRGLGGEVQLAREILSSNLGLRPERNEFHQSVILYLVNHRTEIQISEVGPLIDFINAKKYGFRERGAINNPDYSLKGRKAAGLRREMAAWHQRLQSRRRPAYNPETESKWSPSKIGDFSFVDEETKSVWNVSELLDSRELYDEGRFMHHCVSSYRPKCETGRTSIWSVRRDGFRVLTVEVDPGSRVIRQIRGVLNRKAEAKELKILDGWVKTGRAEGMSLKRAAPGREIVRIKPGEPPAILYAGL